MTRQDRSPERTLDLEKAGCGDLAIGLQKFFRDLPARTRVRVIARDPGAPYDIPAWCRMTGHRLQAADPPDYVIESRER